jgi:hypothetical protein
MALRKSRAHWLQEKFAGLLLDVETEVARHYGERLVSLIVFGSVGRSTPRMDSDLDMLIVADPLQRGRIKRVGEFKAVKDALGNRLRSLERDGIFTTLAPIFKTRSEVRQGSLLFLDMIDDGKILYDREDFWQTYLAQFRERLRGLGARKIFQGDRWYWDLKPDYKPGEIFEI